AAAGGGGKGMRIVMDAAGLPSAYQAAQSEARGAFGDDRVYLEKYVLHPRHVEIQVIADRHGHAVYLGERECSIQRRHQKVIEETPSVIVSPEMRVAMGTAAVRLAVDGGYTNAGTVEFIVNADRDFYFLEMNTRLQVEHPITEMVTGIDLVREQIRVAQGEELSFRQEDVRPRGHAIECRICAEDPANNFFPSTGRLHIVEPPSGPFIRVENGVRSGDEVSMFYDPLLAKVVTWGEDRQQAVERMLRALDEFVIAGIHTTIPFCRFVLTDPEFIAGRFDTHFVADRYRAELLDPLSDGDLEAAAVAAAFMRNDHCPGTSSRTVMETPTTTPWMLQKRDFLR
ncbi:MAG: acetyl-CoA carboxylase biotin carboxylase subunit, partial [Bacteroidetes bacterium]|nr:acetyl-CoA carboxylase biotin carboxylase subunit [Bacteroidota bacterium]